MIFGTKDVNLSHLDPIQVSYAPKGIITEAIEVRDENIGKLALEFETELRYYDTGLTWFTFMADRDAEPPLNSRKLLINVGFWIVVLWGELHVFRDKEFQSTFVQVAYPIQLAVSGETPGGFGLASGEISRGDGTDIVPVATEEQVYDANETRSQAEQYPPHV